MLNFGGKVALKKQAEFVPRSVDYDYLFKMLLVGDRGVGKSCLLLRFADGDFFQESYISTIGVDFKVRTIKIDGRVIKVQVWDTTGQERFRTITSSYYRGAHGCMLIYSVCQRDTFNSIKSHWLSEVERQSSGDSSRIIVGNKIDGEREVSTEEGASFAASVGLPFIETSARTNTNVEQAFETVVREWLKTQSTSSEVMRSRPALSAPAPAPESKSITSGIFDSIMGFFSTKKEPEVTPSVDGNVSDEEDFADDDLDDDFVEKTTSKTAAPLKEKEKKGPVSKKSHEKADVNVFRLDLSKISQDAQVVTGEPVFCGKCSVTFNCLSKIQSMESAKVSELNAVLLEGKKEPAFAGVKDLFFLPETSTTTTTTTTTSSSSSSSNNNNNVNNDINNNNNVNNDINNNVNNNDEATAITTTSSSSSTTTTTTTTTTTITETTSEMVNVWCCEFCGFYNIVNLEEEERPKADLLDYIISAAPEGSKDEQNIIFCVDISGSMCVTSEVDSDLAFKKPGAQRDAHLRAQGEGDQRLPRERRGVKYVSRLECVQAAIEKQILEIAKVNPKYKVGLITFSNEVSIIGDGTQDPLVVTGDKLSSFSDLKQLGETYEIKRNVSEAGKDLISRVWALEESGCTALGPALLLSILISGSRPASKVILSTDGLANSGLGSLDGTDFTPFYTECAENARVKGVTVSVLSLQGEDCNLENLSIVAEQTGGEIERVVPQDLANNFKSILTTPIIATGCMAIVFLPKALMFKNEIEDEIQTSKNLLVRDLGNITAETECTFSYGFRPKTQVDISDLTEIAFQVQLIYTKPDGMKCLRTATSSIQTTDNRAEAEESADLKVIGTHAAQKAAKYAKEGKYEKAQLEARAAKRLMERKIVSHNDDEEVEGISNWMSNVGVMDREIKNERMREKEEGSRASESDRRAARKGHDTTSVAISKTKHANTKKLFM